jgi:hypothetical protein
VDAASLAALDIFKEEEHPSAMGIGSSKEGVSVYGLLQRCVTGMVRYLHYLASCPTAPTHGFCKIHAVSSVLSHSPTT